MKINKTLIAGGLGLLAFVGIAISQTISVPQVSILNPTDLFQVIPLGQPTASNVYATPSLITAQNGYQKASPATFAGNGYTFAANQTYLVLTNASVIANMSVTLAAAPSDGAKECVFSQNGVTAFQIIVASGQTIHNAVTTLAAATGVCYVYSASNLTWDRS
jgi:hypothetical protein